MGWNELTKEIKMKYPDINVLILTMHKNKEFIRELILAEADGYILKDLDKSELIKAIFKIIDDGTTFYCDEITPILKELITEPNNKRNEKESEEKIVLTKREIEVLQLLCKDHNSREIAEKLNIAKTTVDKHRANILEKTGQKSTIGLMRWAIENGLFE